MADTGRAVPSRVDWPEWPDYGLVDDLLPGLLDWHAAGRRFALATLVQVSGSSPRPVGAQMAVRDDGSVLGYVSGGCVEAAVATEALAVLAGDPPKLLDYGAGSPALDIQLSCGGRIHIWVAAVTDAAGWLARWQGARHARQPLEEAVCWQDGDRARRLPLRRDPPLRLVLVGGDPVTLALLQLAQGLGMDVSLLRPGGPRVPPPGLDPSRYDPRPLHEAIASLSLDAWTAVYTLTHDADLDHAVLRRALASDAFAVGALGSRRKAGLRIARLQEDGIPRARLARLRSPAGLDIGGRTPLEIALSIAAEIVARRPLPA